MSAASLKMSPLADLRGVFHAKEGPPSPRQHDPGTKLVAVKQAVGQSRGEVEVWIEPMRRLFEIIGTCAKGRACAATDDLARPIITVAAGP